MLLNHLKIYSSKDGISKTGMVRVFPKDALKLIASRMNGKSAAPNPFEKALCSATAWIDYPKEIEKFCQKYDQSAELCMFKAEEQAPAHAILNALRYAISNYINQAKTSLNNNRTQVMVASLAVLCLAYVYYYNYLTILADHTRTI